VFTWGDRNTAVRNAIACFERAIEGEEAAGRPDTWPIHQNLAGAYLSFSPDEPDDPVDPGQLVRKAISHLERAVAGCPRETQPREWARLNLDLALYWRVLPASRPGMNQRRAMGYLEQALSAYSQQDTPDEWASTQFELGCAWVELSGIGKEKNLRKAIACFESALQVYRPHTHAERWIATHYNCGRTCHRLSREAPSLANRALRHYHAALEADAPTVAPDLYECIGNEIAALHTKLGIRAVASA